MEGDRAVGYGRICDLSAEEGRFKDTQTAEGGKRRMIVKNEENIGFGNRSDTVLESCGC